MLKAIHKRMQQDDKGFTLIELMVVVLIIAILLAIAIPTFLRVRRSAQDRAAQSSLSDALKAEKAHYVDDSNLVYTDQGAELEAIEPSINYDAAAGDSCAAFVNAKCVQVTVTDTVGGAGGGVDQEVLLISQSSSGTFWALRDVASGTGAGASTAGTYYNDDGDAAAPAAANVSDSNW